jgi:GTPase
MDTDIKIAVIGNVDAAKCLGKSTKVMLYNESIKPVEQVKIGDLLMGDDWKPRKVLETTNGIGQLYKVKNEYRGDYVVNSEHILVLKNIDGKIIEITVKDYLSCPDLQLEYKYGYKVTKKKSIVYLVEIEKYIIDEYYGFELDGNGRFLLHDGTVTHNSTLIGTLLKGKNDDGRGSNREIVMNYKHEKETGQTSSIGYQILGFRNDGSIINVDNHSTKLRKLLWPKIMQETKKLITFMDLAGHEKYLKTTIHGLSSNYPDYTMIVVEGRGVRGMTKEHLMLALSFDIPIILIITKIDLYDKETINATVHRLTQMLKTAKKDVWLIREKIDIEIPRTNKYIPFFFVSNVSGEGLNLLKEYLFKLPKRLDYTDTQNKPFEASVLESFIVEGIGTVAHCYIVIGTLKKGDIVWVGPDSLGNFYKTKIRTVQYKRIDVDFVLPGHHCTICLPNIDKNLLKKGVYVLHDNVQERLAIRYFTADIKLLTTHQITIKKGYCPILNIDNLRITAKILDIQTDNKEIEFLQGGDHAIVKFKFVYRPAYIKNGTTFVFREGKTRGFGKVLSLDNEKYTNISKN